MTVDTYFNPETETLVIKITGNFEFGLYADFRKAMQQVSSGMKTIVVDLQDSEDMDCAALGMLIGLRNRTQSYRQNLQLLGAKGLVQNCLWQLN